MGIGSQHQIGASSVVTKDIPPYAIVVGNPARVLRMRCEDKWIERLEKIQWWNFPETIIRDNFDLFQADLALDVIERFEQIKEDLCK